MNRLAVLALLGSLSLVGCKDWMPQDDCSGDPLVNVYLHLDQRNEGGSKKERPVWTSETVLFSYHLDGRAAQLTFSPGDGTAPFTPGGHLISHQYSNPGDYLASLSAVDYCQRGAANFALRVEVADPNVDSWEEFRAH